MTNPAKGRVSTLDKRELEGELLANLLNMSVRKITSNVPLRIMANCQAAREGLGGRDAASIISEGREYTDQYIKGDPRSACDADRAANSQGRNGNPNIPCSQVCGSLRPNGLNPRY